MVKALMKKIFSQRHVDKQGLIPLIYKENINELIDKVKRLEKEVEELKNNSKKEDRKYDN